MYSPTPLYTKFPSTKEYQYSICFFRENAWWPHSLAAASTLFVQFLKKRKVLQIMSKLWYRNDDKSSVKAISVVSFNSKSVLKSDSITFIIWFSTKNKPSLHFLVIKQSFTASRKRLGRAIGHWTPNIRKRGSTAMQRVLENVCQIKSTRCLIEVNWGSALTNLTHLNLSRNQIGRFVVEQ